MHQEKIEFPKFTVPGQTNWTKWVLVSVGGLVVLSAFAFGVALTKRNQTPSEVATPSRVDVPPAPSATPPPAPQPARALAATAAPPVDTATASDSAPAPAKAAAHRPHRSHGARTKTLAKAPSSSASKPGKPDAIDELLKRFK
jgi:hypothetical protein